MESKVNNNISFKTNIIFLSPSIMIRTVNKMRQSDKYMQIDNWYVRPPEGNENLKGYRTNCALGYTYQVRSCTAGVSVKKGKNAPYFWHIQDIIENIRSLTDMRNITNCDNIILFGSKSEYFKSQELFNGFESFIKRDNIPATIMKNMSLNWQAFAAYIAENDTLFMCIQKIYGFPRTVHSMKKLNKVFETITVSPTDNLKFPNYLQEILLLRNLKFKK